MTEVDRRGDRVILRFDPQARRRQRFRRRLTVLVAKTLEEGASWSEPAGAPLTDDCSVMVLRRNA